MDGSFQVKLHSHVRRMLFELPYRKFVSLGSEARKSTTMKLASRHESLNLVKTASIAEEMVSVRFLHSN